MIQKCLYLRQRHKKGQLYYYCTKQRKEIGLCNCRTCSLKEYKQYRRLEVKTPMKNKTKKQAKLEKERFSLFTDDLEHCIICGKRKEHLHEVYPGAFRLRSIKEHMVLPLCLEHHRQIHNDIELSLYWKRLCQQKFEESHTRDEFIKIFGRSYLK